MHSVVEELSGFSLFGKGTNYRQIVAEEYITEKALIGSDHEHFAFAHILSQ